MEMRWASAGSEPAIADLLDDPIAVLLREYDGLSEADVWRVVEWAVTAQARYREAA